MLKAKLFSIGSLILLLATLVQCASIDTVSGSLSRLGFSISDSTSALLKSLSTSVSSISDSVSGGKEEAQKAAFRADVKSTMALFFKHPRTQKDLELDLAMIAKEHGITNWKNNSNTYLGIGQGLKSAGADEKYFDSLLDRVAKNNEKMATLLREGYKS